MSQNMARTDRGRARTVQDGAFRRFNRHRSETPLIIGYLRADGAFYRIGGVGMTIIINDVDSAIRLGGTSGIVGDKMVALMKGEFPELDLHAGEWETALCLWRFPELVKQDVLQNLPPNWVNLREKLYEQGCRDFVEAGGSQCYFGDPSCATAELGQKIYVALVSALTEEVIEWLAKI